MVGWWWFRVVEGAWRSTPLGPRDSYCTPSHRVPSTSLDSILSLLSSRSSVDDGQSSLSLGLSDHKARIYVPTHKDLSRRFTLSLKLVSNLAWPWYYLCPEIRSCLQWCRLQWLLLVYSHYSVSSRRPGPPSPAVPAHTTVQLSLILENPPLSQLFHLN